MKSNIPVSTSGNSRLSQLPNQKQFLRRFSDLVCSKLYIGAYWVAFVGLYLFKILQAVTWEVAAKMSGRPLSEDDYHHFIQVWGRQIMALAPTWKFKMIGKENIPEGPQAFVITANHQSTADIFIMCRSMISFRFLSKHTVFNLPFFGYVMRKAGYVSVDRSNKMQAARAFAQCRKVLKKNRAVLFFPEGTRNQEAAPGEYKSGAFRLAVKANCPILPVVIHGANQIFKGRSANPGAGFITLSVLPLIYPEAGEDAASLASRVEQVSKQEFMRLEASI